MAMVNLLNGKDSRWLQLEVCREFQRQKCSRPDTECKFAHPPANVEVQNGRVTACYDSIKVGIRKQPPQRTLGIFNLPTCTKDYKKKGSDKATAKMGVKSKTGSNNNKTDSCEEANNIITKSKKNDSFASLCKKENKHDSCGKDDPCKKQDLGACRKIENPCKKEKNTCKTEQDQCTKSEEKKTDTFALLSEKVNKHDPDQADDSCTSPKDFCKKYEDCAKTNSMFKSYQALNLIYILASLVQCR